MIKKGDLVSTPHGDGVVLCWEDLTTVYIRMVKKKGHYNYSFDFRYLKLLSGWKWRKLLHEYSKISPHIAIVGFFIVVWLFLYSITKDIIGSTIPTFGFFVIFLFIFSKNN